MNGTWLALAAAGGALLAGAHRGDAQGPARTGSAARKKVPKGADHVAQRVEERQAWRLRPTARHHSTAEAFAEEMEEELLDDLRREERGLARSPLYGVVLDANGEPTRSVDPARRQAVEASLRPGERLVIRPDTARKRRIAALRREYAARAAAWAPVWQELVKPDAWDGVHVHVTTDPFNGTTAYALEDGRKAGYVYGVRTRRLERLRCRADVEALAARLGFGEAPFVWVVQRSHLAEHLHGRGIGRQMYEALFAAVAEKAGHPVIFVPERCDEIGATSREAERVWQSLARRYIASGSAVSSVKREPGEER